MRSSVAEVWVFIFSMVMDGRFWIASNGLGLEHVGVVGRDGGRDTGKVAEG